MPDLPTTEEFRGDHALAGEHMPEILDALDEARTDLEAARSERDVALDARHDRAHQATMDELAAIRGEIESGAEDRAERAEAERDEVRRRILAALTFPAAPYAPDGPAFDTVLHDLAEVGRILRGEKGD